MLGPHDRKRRFFSSGDIRHYLEQSGVRSVPDSLHGGTRIRRKREGNVRSCLPRIQVGHIGHHEQRSGREYGIRFASRDWEGGSREYPSISFPVARFRYSGHRGYGNMVESRDREQRVLSAGGVRHRPQRRGIRCVLHSFHSGGPKLREREGNVRSYLRRTEVGHIDHHEQRCGRRCGICFASRDWEGDSHRGGGVLHRYRSGSGEWDCLVRLRRGVRWGCGGVTVLLRVGKAVVRLACPVCAYARFGRKVGADERVPVLRYHAAQKHQTAIALGAPRAHRVDTDDAGSGGGYDGFVRGTGDLVRFERSQDLWGIFPRHPIGGLGCGIRYTSWGGYFS